MQPVFKLLQIENVVCNPFNFHLLITNYKLLFFWGGGMVGYMNYIK